MEYKEAKAFLDGLLDRERVVRPSYPDSLDDFVEFLQSIGNPHKGLNAILVAGTKGKGSTAFLVSRILQAHGLKTGLFTSPHLIEVRERIKLDSRCIPERDFGDYIERIAPYITGAGFRSVFETLTTLAFMYFNENKADFSVFEVGLGGRLDATNVTEPVVSVLTDISYDHTHILGKTLREITREKLGITRKDVPLVSAPQTWRVREYVRKFSKGKVFFVGVDEPVEVVKNSLEGVIFKYRGEDYFLPMPGRHQAINACVAIEACIKAGVDIFPSSVQKGFEEAIWPGRFQVVKKDPLVVLDGAHNEKSVKVLVKTWKEVVSGKATVIFTAMKRKPVRRMLNLLNEVAEEFVFTTLPLKRALDIDGLKNIAFDMNIEAKGFSTPEEAWEYASAKNTPILVTGSLYLVGKILSLANYGVCN